MNHSTLIRRANELGNIMQILAQKKDRLTTVHGEVLFLRAHISTMVHIFCWAGVYIGPTYGPIWWTLTRIERAKAQIHWKWHRRVKKTWNRWRLFTLHGDFLWIFLHTPKDIPVIIYIYIYKKRKEKKFPYILSVKSTNQTIPISVAPRFHSPPHLSFDHKMQQYPPPNQAEMSKMPPPRPDEPVMGVPFYVVENPYQAGMIPPNAVYGDPKGIPIPQTIYRDTPAPFNCVYCGDSGLTTVR